VSARLELLSLPIRRPVATSMLFLAIVLLGVIGWQRIPVELMPPVSGDLLWVSFVRPGSDPEVVEREILMPLEARVSELPGVEETWGEVRGFTGSFQVRFEPGTDLKVRELELQQIAAEIVHGQPRDATISVSAQDLSAISQFVMTLDLIGGTNRNALRDLAEEEIEPRLAAVTGVNRVMIGGGAPREVTVHLDSDRCAANGVTPSQVVGAIGRAVRRLSFLGGAEDEAGRTAIMLDGRPRGIVSLGETRITPQLPVLLRHVAEVEHGTARQDMLFRVNGQQSVGLFIFQEEDANLVRLGRALRQRIDELREELAPYGIDLIITIDAAEIVDEQLDRLKKLGLSGFLIALAVLFLFLRELRAVAVVAVAVPVSLLAALALLFVFGYSLNLMTLFGLALGVGMLVDNSIVVYEAVQQRLERGIKADDAAVGGIRRTVRAIFAASATTAVVFLPVAFTTEDSMTRGLLVTLAVAILLPLAASLLVAVGLVPLLAQRLAAPAAISRLAMKKRWREALAGLVKPERSRELFSGVLKVALRSPAGWLSGVAAAVLFTVVVALPGIMVGTATQEAAEADEVRLAVEVDTGGSLEATAERFAYLEQKALELNGVLRVQSMIQEEGGSITVRLVDEDERPEDISVARVRNVVRRAAEELKGITILTTGADGSGGGGSDSRSSGGSLLGQGPAEVALSGPDARQLLALAEEIKSGLQEIDEVASVTTSVSSSLDEIRVKPREMMLSGYGLTPDQVLPALSMVRREGVQMQTGFTLANGREIPLTVRTLERGGARIGDELAKLRLATPAGVLPLSAVASVSKMPPPPVIQHHNGRREMSVFYTLESTAPQSGSARLQLDERIRSAVRDVHRPVGYTVEALGEDEAVDWFKKILIPVVLLLLAVLAITFESLTLPVLILIALPLTVLGATWALVFAGMGANIMALVGTVTLLGLTVNPAILLVDRMQQRVLGSSWTPGAAALAAVRERTRPVLMTTCTTIAGLWPLALSTGRENELWPPFATVVMGGLGTSTLLTLLVIPVGFVLLSRLDRVFGRLGPWIVIGWAAATTAVMAPLIVLDQITTMRWQLTTTLLVGGLFLGAAVLLFRRRELPEPAAGEGAPPVVEVRYLRKVYGRPGPIGRAWRMGTDFARRVVARGGEPLAPRESWEKAQSLAVVLLGAGYLALNLQTMWWRLVFSLIAAALAGRVLIEVRRARGRRDALGRVEPGGVENLLAMLAPWIVLVYLGLRYNLIPYWAEESIRFPTIALVLVAAILLILQLGRRTAKQLAEGNIKDRLTEGFLRRSRTIWRRLSRRLFGLDLPREQIEGLATIHFRAERGMVGILGPNGAGKTTLLRLLAGILEPSLGTITYGGVKIGLIRRYLARWVGYLPQDFGLPKDMTAREYLDYYALLYRIGSDEVRRKRVQDLLDEVGLGERADDKIGGYSGGMRQRVAVARTLLRLPPVIIVDEPTVGLDPRERIRFRNLLARLAEGRVVLFSTHVVEDVAVACERVIVLARGAVVFDGEPARLATAATGNVWEAKITPEQESELSEGSLVVDHVPEADGRSRLRIICHGSPHHQARAIEPSLEDGYLVLVGKRDEEEAA
jgi:multidrug efflux pump subunit AcrB/ABC-type multidrug transport system ATPase subunit